MKTLPQFCKVLITLCLLTLAQAQTAQDLIGTWQTQSKNISITQTISEDGTYTFEAPAENYFEKGTWQLDGANFSQQWQDPRTGEAQQTTYTLEFLSTDSFRQSGGNLGDEVYTFTKVMKGVATPTTNPLSTSPTSTSATSATPLELESKETLVRLPPPEAGEYRCSHSSLTFGTTFDPTGDFGSTMPVYGVNTMESLVGSLMLDGNGNYTMTKSGGAGTYSFDAATNELSFTGELAAFPIRYFVDDGFFTVRLNFLDANKQEESSLDCSHGSVNAVAPTTSTPNPGLPGTLGLHTSDDQIIRFVAETGELQIIGEGMQPYQGENGETIFLSNNEFTILAPEGTLAARLELDDRQDTSNSTSVEDIFAAGYAGVPNASDPVLSGDASLIAYSSVDDLGNQSVNVRRRNGNSSELIAVIPDMSQPSWTKDGGLIMAGGARATGSLSSVEGIYITDATFANPRAIGTNLVSPEAPVLNPDGTTIAFLQDNALWLMGSDGSNPRAVVSQPDLNVYGYPAWSPDGQWLAVAAAEQNFEAWSWILVLPVNGNTRKAQRLELPTLDPIIVSRDSRITWW
jgi:WD40-like Beta Propeller Repeat